jgi:hypothetical protein
MLQKRWNRCRGKLLKGSITNKKERDSECVSVLRGLKHLDDHKNIDQAKHRQSVIFKSSRRMNGLLNDSTIVLSNDTNTYLPPWSRVLLEKLRVAQLVKKFPVFYGTPRFISVFTRVRYWFPFWDRWIQSKPSHPVSLRSVLQTPNIQCSKSQPFSVAQVAPKNPFNSKFLCKISQQVPVLRRGVVSPAPNSQVGGPPPTVRDCLFNTFTATHNMWRLSSPSATRRRAMSWWTRINMDVSTSQINIPGKYCTHQTEVCPSTLFINRWSWCARLLS